ncbi:glycosyltransferase [Streptomyces sp. NPDC004111]|uniref:glycosyltransferase n=1 Tax=Streptomyces sp. NPDC004111 TaxID=3364690 RepID=UPI003680C33B
MDLFLVSGSTDTRFGPALRSRQLAGLFAGAGHHVHLIGIAPGAEERRAADAAPGDSGGPDCSGGGPAYRVSTLYDGPPPAAPGRARRRAGPVGRLRRRAHERGMRAKAEELSALFRERPGGPGSAGVVVVTEGWALEWVALADTAGLSVVVMSHEPYAVTKRSGRYQRLRWLYRQHADRVLAPTRQDADWWIRSWLNNVGVMPSPLIGRPELPSPRTGRCVVFVGRLDHDKGTDILLDAWAQLAPHHPGWLLRLYGDATDRAGGTGARARADALHKQCAELGISASVEWMGYAADVPRVLAESAVFVLPSRQEGFPLAPLEAMAAGLPCVAFDVSPGVRELVTDGVDGLLARPGNVDELARQLARLLTDRELRERLGDAAREKARRYAPEVVAERWEELFALLRK